MSASRSLPIRSALTNEAARNDLVFHALADKSRRRLLDSLNTNNGQRLQELCSEMNMTRQAVSKHLAILEKANLVTTIWHGREKLHYLNPIPINEIGERWISRFELDRVHALADLKKILEESPMEKPEFVYTTYIKTTPERLWQALTEPAFTKRWWNFTLDTDWKVGSPMTWTNEHVVVEDPAQVVLESDPYNRLSYTWLTHNRELATYFGFSDELYEALLKETRSKVTFELEPTGAHVKLAVVHDGFDADSALISMISHGWPEVLSSLKSLIETGEPLGS